MQWLGFRKNLNIITKIVLIGLIFMFGQKISKKEIARQRLFENKNTGMRGEETAMMQYDLRGEDVERTGRGSDFRITRRNLFGEVKERYLEEEKTGNAKLSKLQKETKKKNKNYKVNRVKPYFY